MTDTARLDTLETRIAYQDEVIEDLNKTVIAQWKEIDRLSRQVTRLIEQSAQAAEGGSVNPRDEPPPPHW
jgi:SlyX protein